MKHYLILPAVLFFCSQLAGQSLQQQAEAVKQEGISLYRSEMASWYGTDIFMAKYANKDQIGGYFSYTEGNISKCIFISKDESPKVIGTISFDSTYNTRSAESDLTIRDLSILEKELFILRKKTLALVNSNDSLFKFYKKTNYNLVPLISNGERKVYILTGPQDNGVVIFGNDYLLRFNDNNELISKKRLHISLIMMKYGEAVSGDEKTIGGVHTHLPETGDLMTATDICTLLLYAKFAGWKQHMVISEKYMNIWNCESETLTVIPR